MADIKKFETALAQFSDGTVRFHEPLSQHSTFRIGGEADYFAEPASADDMAKLLKAAVDCGVPARVIGRGSNLLFADEGFRGLILSTGGMKSVTVQGNTVAADAGVSLTALSKAALEASLTGLEFANGIPGSVGGAVFMNAGAYEREISHVLSESVCLDTATGALRTLKAEEHAFSYRHSVYRDHPEYIVVSAAFSLTVGEAEQIRACMDDLMRRRTEKQPLEYPSAGSVFKRCEGRYTAKMIDEAGLKGLTIGGAQVSEKHAGFIINRGGATAGDVLALIRKIQDELRRLHGIDIETEVVFVPSDPQSALKQKTV